MEVPTFEYQYAFGYKFGITAEYYLTPKLSLKTGLDYDKKNAKGTSVFELREGIDSPGLLYNQTVVYHYNYLTMPLLVKYDFSEHNSFYINGGAFFGYLLNSKVTSKTEPKTEFSDISEATTKSNASIDYGVAFGLGKTIAVDDKNSIHVELRDNFGVARTNKGGTFNGNAVKSNSFNLILSWSLQL